MMNWQARMSGDTIVSKMIESLSTVLDYRMNRANVKEIHLAEELQCVDAYFYIMSMLILRFLMFPFRNLSSSRWWKTQSFTG